MGPPTEPRRRLLPAVAVALSLTVIFVVVLSVPLGVAADLGLTTDQLTAWIVALYGSSAVVSLALVWRYRQPLLMTGNIFVLIFVASLDTRLSWAELIGASITAGTIVLALGLLGLTDRLATWLPAPVVYGVLAGAVLPFFVGLFDARGEQLLIVGATLVAFLVGRRFLEPRIPAVLPALIAGLVAAALTGGLGTPPAHLSLPVPTITTPQFSLGALLTATPIMVALITLQANAPSVVFLRSQDYRPPERALTVVSGAGTLIASLFGPVRVSLSLPATALSAGPDAGPHATRHHAVVLTGAITLVLALLAGYAADLETLIAPALLVAVIGLAVIGVFTTALRQVVAGPLLLGPIIAFGVTVSDLTLFGLGPVFWALVLGLGVSRLIERDAWAALQGSADSSQPGQPDASARDSDAAPSG